MTTTAQDAALDQPSDSTEPVKRSRRRPMSRRLTLQNSRRAGWVRLVARVEERQEEVHRALAAAAE